MSISFQEQEAYQNIVEHSIAAIILSKPETGSVYFANQAASSIYGYSFDEFCSMHRNALFEVDQQFVDGMEQRRKYGKFIGIVTGKRKNGDRFPCEISSVVFRDRSGCEKALTTLIDITEKFNAEEELRKTNEKYRMATQASFDAVWDADLVTASIYWGEGFSTLFGYETGNRPGAWKDWEDGVHPEDRERVLGRLSYVLSEKSTDKFWKDEYKFFRADGSIAYVADQGMILRNGSGKAYRFVGSMRDITELKQKEQELLQINRRFQLASKATSDIIWEWDLETNIIDWSSNMKIVMGHSLPPSHQLPLEFCVNHIHPNDRQLVIDSLEKVKNDLSAKTWECQFRYARANGTYAYVNDRGHILRDEKGKAVKMIGAMQDITRSKYHESLLEIELAVYEAGSNPAIPFTQLVYTLLEGIEMLHPDLHTCIFLLDDQGKIKNLPSPRLPDEFTGKLNGKGIGEESGCCGTSMLTKTSVVIEDILTDPICSAHRKISEELDIKSCFTLPILRGDSSVLGCFAAYYKSRKTPGDTEIDTISKLCRLLTVLMEKSTATDQMRISNERFHLVTEATHDMVWDWDLETGEVYRESRGLQKVYGYHDNSHFSHIEDWLEHVHRDDKEKVKCVIDEILSSSHKDVFDVEYRFRRADGDYSFVYDRGIIMRKQDGKPYRMIGAAQNVTERKNLERRLLAKELQKQREISQAVIDTQEQERSDIGRELHDNVNQVLTTTKLYLDLASTEKEKQAEFIKKSSENILYVINEIRKLSRSLMLPSLGDLGLYETINDLVESINITQKFRIDFHGEPCVEKRLSDNHCLIVYRIIQEAINNIIKYANARSVLIHLSGCDKNIQLTISDDGVGFNLSSTKKGSGLKNIENRVYLFNGSLEINTSPGKGCELVITIPLVSEKVPIHGIRKN